MKRAWILPAVWLLLLSCAAGAETIAQAKASANWMQVTVDGIVTYLEPGECYIESPDRTAGIFIIGPTDDIAIGNRVTALGAFSTLMGEPVVIDAIIYPSDTQAEIRPLGMPNRSIGGSSKWSPMWIWDYVYRQVPRESPGCGLEWKLVWAPAAGLNNVGLLVTTCGTVKSICESPTNGAKWLCIDDGSGVISDFGDKGVLVYTDAEVQMGDRITVTGISSTEPSLDTPDPDTPSRLVRVIRTRDVGDVQVTAHAEPDPAYPFSDEFDSPTLDNRWLVITTNGSVSTTSRPGELAVTIGPGAVKSAGGTYPIGPEVVQAAPGDWVIDMKLHAEQFQDNRMRACILLGFKHFPTDQRWRGSSTMQGFLGQSLVRFYYDTRCGLPPGILVWTGIMYWPPDVVLLPADTCYYRLTKTGGQVGIESSLDGLAYHPGTQWVDPNHTGYDYLTLSSALESGTNTEPFTYYIDYIRFTSITQPGGQQ